MWIIAAGDIHMDGRYLLAIKKNAPADLLPLEGDLTNFGHRADAGKVMAQARQANPTVLTQFGNIDQRSIDDYLETIGSNRHNPAVIIDGNVYLSGIGGLNPTPFGTPSEFSEDARGSIASRALCQARQLIARQQRVEKKQIPLILVSHAPSYQNSLDRLVDGPCACSVAVGGCGEHESPDLCICGHIREASEAADTIGTTPVYNPGILRNGGWLEIELTNQKFNVLRHDSIP